MYMAVAVVAAAAVVVVMNRVLTEDEVQHGCEQEQLGIRGEKIRSLRDGILRRPDPE